jgi:hypothetical protein
MLELPMRHTHHVLKTLEYGFRWFIIRLACVKMNFDFIIRELIPTLGYY